MPEISRFYGIIIQFFYNDHTPPHFHATYGEFEALIKIEDFAHYCPKRFSVEFSV
jgi:hypothetical protein